ncbi:MAG: hypothetical protein ACC631_08195 [Halocynthiibacter sp.]
MAKKKSAPEFGLNQTGENLLRFVIASYFLAISVGFIKGTDGVVLFGALLAEPMATKVASVFMFATASLVLLGLMLRLSALLLALVVFWSSYIVNVVPAESALMDAFWRDLALIGALLLTNSQVSPRDAGKRAIVRWKPAVRRLRANTQIIPRRVAAIGSRKPAEHIWPEPTPQHIAGKPALSLQDAKAALDGIREDDFRLEKTG